MRPRSPRGSGPLGESNVEAQRASSSRRWAALDAAVAALWAWALSLDLHLRIASQAGRPAATSARTRASCRPCPSPAALTTVLARAARARDWPRKAPRVCRTSRAARCLARSASSEGAGCLGLGWPARLWAFAGAAAAVALSKLANAPDVRREGWLAKRESPFGSTGIGPVRLPPSPSLALRGLVSTAGVIVTPAADLLLRSARPPVGARGRAFCGGPAPCSFGFGMGL